MTDASTCAEEPRHCDEYVHDYGQPDCLRWWILINRFPADLKGLSRIMGVNPRLYADHNGKRVQVVMASRFGDVGITDDLSAEYGYDNRVSVEALSNFSDRRS